ncbi:leucyl/phenylalanyl-tRNA--protein transferase [Paludibacterium yongneupense]|uniref:leucyl/phenylalanyl-tRNA--protein transferase n=1 Tax=Paludibacterium yongneupense TaxID=400061 RepID=UPI000419F37B|nr:leucyl/phenylalanyl-tRNA--protein transferase [Paludibacterium yongneupense]
MIPWLGRELLFPPLSSALADPDGLLAAGGDLSVRRLLLAYSRGIFPWYSPPEPILWWSPSARMVLFPEQLRVTRSLDKRLRNARYRIRVDSAFRAVMERCARPRPGQSGTWIVPEMVDAYCRLHAAGYAHSFETWVDEKLVGGLYGVSLGGVFFGESMFSLERDASKLAFVHMARHLSGCGVGMIDCQMYTPHLASLGASLIPRAQFLATLEELARHPPSDTLWTYSFDNEPS